MKMVFLHGFSSKIPNFANYEEEIVCNYVVVQRLQ